jgi:hypothetical protein
VKHIKHLLKVGLILAVLVAGAASAQTSTTTSTSTKTGGVTTLSKPGWGG